jgi:hypothetical protein
MSKKYKFKKKDDGFELYIGAKLILAKPMDRHTFLKEYRAGVNTIDTENESGWAVKYADKYVSWSPDEAFRAYRKVNDGEGSMFFSMLQVAEEEEDDI